MELDDELCLCFHVTKRKVINFIRIQQPRRVSQLSECFGAGTGCGWCRKLLQRYFDQAISGGVIDAEAEPTPEQYAQQRAKYIRSGGGTPPPGATPLEPDS